MNLRPVRRAVAAFACLLLLASAQPAYGAGSESTAGSEINRTGGGSGVDGNASQIDRDGGVPWCVSATNKGGYWDPRPVQNNDFFLAPFPGCEGTNWTVAIENCFTGFLVWRFYGTMAAGKADMVVTRSRVNVPRWCATTSNQKAQFFFPNTSDGIGHPALTVDSSRSDFAWHVYRSVYNNTDVVLTSEGIPTTGHTTSLLGDCTKPLTSLPNWYNESIKQNPDATRKGLWARYQQTLSRTLNPQTARLDINAVNVPSGPGDIAFGSTGDCSSIFDYKGYSKTELSAAALQDNTVVVGTCAIPLERPGRVYTGGGHAFWNDSILKGKLGERYSMARFNFGLGSDNVIKQYKEYIGAHAFGSGLPRTPMAWPSKSSIAQSGSYAWNRAETNNGAKVASLVRCDYQSLAPEGDLLGCEYTKNCKEVTRTTREEERYKESGLNSDVYVEVTANLPKYFTASGEIKPAKVTTNGRVLCQGRECGTRKLDPRIISWTYKSQLVGQSGYRSCSSTRERNCDFFAPTAGRNATINALFYSPSAKGESVRLRLVDVAIVIARKVEREVERCTIESVVDEDTGQVIDTVESCWTEIEIVELPPETVDGSLLIPGNTTRTVTGSVGS